MPSWQSLPDGWKDASHFEPGPSEFYGDAASSSSPDVRLDVRAREIANPDRRAPSPVDPEHRGNEVSAASALSLTRWHPFILLFAHYASRHGDHCDTSRSAMDYFARRHSLFYKVCRWLDFLVTLVLVVIVLFMLIIFVWKALEPFPWDVTTVARC